MNEEREELTKLIPCILEVIKTFQIENKTFKLEDLAKELKLDLENLKKLINIAIKNGFLESYKPLLVTKKGEEIIESHRKEYVHDKHMHGIGIFNRISKLFERKNASIQHHLREHHRIDDNAIKSLNSNIQNLKGRIEEIIPLSQLSEGEEAIVSYLLGGYGMIKRLAEMGLTPGTKIKILRRSLFRGPIQIEVRGSCLALGYGVASRVFVKPLRGKFYD